MPGREEEIREGVKAAVGRQQSGGLGSAEGNKQDVAPGEGPPGGRGSIGRMTPFSTTARTPIGRLRFQKNVVGVHAPRSASANFPLKQLEKKWKHASDFGITTTKRNPTTLAQYQQAIAGHLDDVATIEQGTYLYVKDSKVFFNPNTNVAAVLDKDGVFVAGWRLTPGTPQWTNLVNNGVLR